MMTEPGSLKQVAELIQLAIAPIFFLSAVAVTLPVFTARLARIVDRGRLLEKTPAQTDAVRSELLALERRARLIYWGLSLGVSAAMMIALLMGWAFAGELFGFPSARAVAVLFMAALFAYAGALLCVLREVFIALGSFRLGLQAAAPPDKA